MTKQECLKDSNSRRLHRCKHSTFVKLTTCSSPVCHAELCEATDFCTLRMLIAVRRFVLLMIGDKEVQECDASRDE